ncbi:hypothetical protein D3C73_940430 [compost metagenome]
MNQHQADAPGRQQGFQRTPIEMTNHRALQRHADGRGDEKSHRQRNQRIELDGLGREAQKQQLHDIGRVRAQHQHLAVRHVDHPEQAEGDCQAECGEQQNGAQGHAAEGLAEHLADQQFAFDLRQAGLGGSAHRRVGFAIALQQTFQACARQWVTGFTEQAHRGEAHGGIAIHQLQVGQRQAQRGVHALVLFTGQLLAEEFQLRRLGAFLQLLRGGQAHFGIGGEQLMAGQRGVDQAPQAVIQTQGFRLAVDAQFTLLQGVEQFDACRIGLCGPGIQQLGLPGGVGGYEVFAV